MLYRLSGLEQTLNYQKREFAAQLMSCREAAQSFAEMLNSSELERLATLQQILDTRNGAGSNEVNAVNGAIEVGEVTQDDFKATTRELNRVESRLAEHDQAVENFFEFLRF